MEMNMKEYMKKIISSLLILTMFLALAPVSRISGESQENEIVIGDFSYFDTETCTDRFYYSDSYFEKPSYNNDDPHLRTMSLVLALATFASEDLAQKDTFIRDVMTKINLKDIEATDMESSSTDSIGTMIGHKDIGTNELVTVVIRGGGYEKEWASNVTVGKEGDAAGFADGASKTIARIKKYLSDHNITNPKIWISGYSRGAAISNLAAIYINENLEEFAGMTGNDLYAYCFETPAAVNDKSVQYGNIHHVINCNDPITYLYPAQWEMYRTGEIYPIGDSDKIITGRIFSIDDSGAGFAYAKDIKETEYFESLIKLISDTTTRERYADYQTNLGNVLCFYFDLSETEIDTLVNSFNAFKESIMGDYMLLIKILALIGDPGVENELYNDVTEGLISTYESSFGETEKPAVCTRFIELAQTNLKPLLQLLGPIVSKDFNTILDFEYGENYDPDIPMQIDDVASLFNFEGLFTLEEGGTRKINEEVVDDYLQIIQRVGKIIGYHLAYDIAYSQQEAVDAKEFKDYFNCIYEVDEETGIKMYGAFETAYDNGYVDGSLAGAAAQEGYGSAPLFHLATLFSNLSEIIGPHYPKPAMDMVKSKDSYYELSNELVTEDMDYLDTSIFYNRTNNENYTIKTDRSYAEIPAGNAVDMKIPASPAALIFEGDLEDVVDYPAGSLCYFYGGEVSEADLEILKNAMKENDGLGYFALELDIRIKDDDGERSAQLTKGNILVSVEVPDGFIQEGDMEYFVLHLKKDGKVELIPAELAGNYLRFRINSLSPFLFTFKKKVKRYQIPVTGVE